MAQMIEEKKTFKITGVEIFAAGTWNGRAHTVADLHAMCASFSALNPGWIPALKLGHDKNQKLARSSGLPSVGWVERIYVVGDKLLADFDNIPEKIYRLIEKKAYRKVSCEIYYGLEVGDAKYSHVLGAVALLGEELPGVRNLNDILDQYTDHRTSRGEVFAILEKDDTFISYCQNFELAKEPSMSKTEAELKLEQTLEAQKAEFTALKAEKEALEKEKAELAQFKLEADKKAAADAIALQEQKLKTFVADLKGKKLLTPATEKIVEQLAGESAEFSFEDKKLTKEEMFEKLLTLTSEAAKVNFEESSLAEYAKAKDKGDENKKDEKAISEYMEKEKCSYQAAYKAVMKAKAK